MFKVAIVCMSDKGYSGEREDLSSNVIEEILIKNNYAVSKKIIIPDDYSLIKDTLKNICDNNLADLILTTGGTGFSKRDVTPEATLEVCEKIVPGIPEAIRAYSMTITKRAMLSRAVAGIRKDTLIINLPGSPKAVKESLEYILPSLNHGLEILTGSATDCATK
ncbi:MAG: MogA/MoaB family molybdenum cofactor biosynthesis protein [Fusobacterium sp.]|nr:MogA/MoaB family molybdenum cofactor biosynthesis protein [Fusobacterium sp.]